LSFLLPYQVTFAKPPFSCYARKSTECPLVYPGQGLTKFDPYTGYLTDYTVWVVHKESMTELFTYGSFGKGTLSRSSPEYEANSHQEGAQPVDRGTEKQSNRRVERERSGFHRKSRVTKKKRPAAAENTELRDKDFEDVLPKPRPKKQQRARKPTPLKCRGWWPPFNVAEASDISAIEQDHSDVSWQQQISLPIRQEFLQLGLEESFYLLHELACLKIVATPQAPVPLLIERLRAVSLSQVGSTANPTYSHHQL